MSDISDCAASTLLCSENSNLCFDDLDSDGSSDHFFAASHHENDHHLQNNESADNGFEFSSPSDESVSLMAAREKEHLPRDDYLGRLRSGDVDVGIRREGLEWIWKAASILNLTPLTVCLSVNYLDRFLSLHEVNNKCRAWAVRLLAVACVSVAAKMEETEAVRWPDLQVGEPGFVFGAEAIKRMELLVLTTLNWRMQAVTPFSFLGFFLRDVSGNRRPSRSLFSRSAELVLSAVKAIDFLEFIPSEIAAAVAVFVHGEESDTAAAARCSIHVEKGKLPRCMALIGSVGEWLPPESPVGVLDAAARWSRKTRPCETSPRAAGKRRRIDGSSSSGGS